MRMEGRASRSVWGNIGEVLLRPHSAPIRNNPVDQRDVRRLHDMVVKARLTRSRERLLLAPSGKRDQMHIGNIVANSSGDLVAQNIRKSNVQEADIRLKLRGQGDGAVAVVRLS